MSDPAEDGMPLQLAIARWRIKKALSENGIRHDTVSPKQITAMAKRLLRTEEKEEECERQ